MSLAGKVVLVTGAAGGVGSELAQQLVSKGARVALLDLHATPLETLVRELGDNAHAWTTDITRGDELEGAVAAVADRFGGIDVVVANAGVITIGAVQHADMEASERVIEVNLLGSWRTARATMRHLATSNGYLLFVSSLSGTMQGPLQATYNASKAGIHALANTLRLEVEGIGVSVGVAQLSYTDTETGREAVNHLLYDSLRGMPKTKPVPVAKTCATLVRAIERRARTVVVPSYGRVFLLAPGLLQRVVESRARRRQWAASIRDSQAPTPPP